MILKVLILGKEASGKTSVLSRLSNKDYSDQYMATIGVDFSRIYYDVSKDRKIHLWDTSGASRFAELTKSYYKGSYVLLYCIDLSNTDIYQNIDEYIRAIESALDVHTFKSVIIVGTKSDNPSKGFDKLTPIGQLQRIAQTVASKHENLDIQYLSTSAKENCNITTNEGLLHMLHAIFKKVITANTVASIGQSIYFSARTLRYYNKVFFKPATSVTTDNILNQVYNLLEDYANVSFWSRILHPNRHHRKAVSDILLKIKTNQITSVADVLDKSYEIRDTDTFNHNGPLARRIAFILKNENPTMQRAPS